ncbi:MAG: hypothetical protein INR70_26590, partial [Parafilimonas terrae]|nr:hypothetical protein [Parafilimonas terrae]
MLIAFFGTGASAANAHAALLATHAVATSSKSVTLVRARSHGELGLAVRLPGHVRLVEAEPVAGIVAGLVGEELERGGRSRASLILDLPVGLFREEALRERLNVSVVTVGASPLDEMLAASALAPHGAASQPESDAGGPWLLGCDRPDHASAALQFERAMREAVPGRRDGCRGARFLPVNLPTPSPAEAASLLAGTPGEAALRRGLRLLASLMPGAGTPPAIAGQGGAP